MPNEDMEVKLSATATVTPKTDQGVEEAEDDTPPNIDNWNRSFIRSMLSGSGGSVSVARVCLFNLVHFALGWVTYIVIRRHELPEMMGLAGFLSLVIPVVYFPGKIGQMLAQKRG